MSNLAYVVLRHEGIGDPHFDLMFETSVNSKLRTWRARNWPLRTGDVLVQLGDHRREYLTFEGALTGDRGSVRRVQSGVFLMSRSTDAIFQGVFEGESEFTFVRQGDDSWYCAVVSA